jgi:DNA-binding LacI/PurR family transcriptional regulator
MATVYFALEGAELVGIRDLARHLSISIGTVSRALNDKIDVNSETRIRVREAATRLGYSPNQSGRSLRRGKTDLVGIIVPVGSDNTLINMVFLSVLDGLRRKLSERRLDLAIFLHGEDEDGFGSLRRLTERGLVDGVIISNTLQLDPRIDYLVKMHRPFVAFGRSLSGGDHSWVDPDFVKAVEASIERLAGLGHRRIALMLPDGQTHYLHLILKAYRDALRRRGLALDAAFVQRRAAGENGGYLAGESFLGAEKPPTAILVSEAMQSLGLYRKLNEAGLQPGRDISIIGILPEERAQILAPKLTTYQTDWTAIGVRLGEALIAAMARPARVIQSIMPVALRAGESVHSPSET